MTNLFAYIEQHLHRRQAIVTRDLTLACEEAVRLAQAGEGKSSVRFPNGTMLTAEEAVDLFKLHEFVAVED